MTGNGRKVSREKQAIKENQEKNLNHVKQKAVKVRVKKDLHNPPDQHDKVAKKKRCKTVRHKKDVHNPLDRIRQMEPLKGSSQQYVYHFTGCLKERNVGTQQNNTQLDRSSRPQTARSHINSQVTQREPAQICPKKSGYIPEFHHNSMHAEPSYENTLCIPLIQPCSSPSWLGWWGSSPALERTKKLDSADKARLMRRQQSSITPKKVRNVVPLQLTLRNITVPLPFTYDELQATHRTMSRAQAFVEMVQQSRLNTPQTTAHLQGLSALAPDLPPRQTKAPEMMFTGKNCVMGINVNVSAGEVEANCLKEDVTRVVVPEVGESTEPRFITPKQVSLFEDWRPEPGSQKLLKPQSVDRGQWQRQEIERQQDRRFAQKLAMRKKELRYFRRLEGVGRNIDDIANTTSTPARDTQSIANFPIREDVEESARGYAKFLYRPGAAWRNVSSDFASFSSFGPNLNMLSDQQSESTRPTSCEAKKSTTEIVVAICSANARRETMRKDLAQRLRHERVRKKMLLAQERAATRLQHLQCKCC